eukprot:COSAG02_NODE_10808_length_1855_cov_1.167426_1_plen_81_part_10
MLSCRQRRHGHEHLNRRLNLPRAVDSVRFHMLPLPHPQSHPPLLRRRSSCLSFVSRSPHASQPGNLPLRIALQTLSAATMP